MTVPGSTTAIPLDPLTTVLVLPDGAVHSRGTLLSGREGEQELLSEASRFPREQAMNLQRPVRVSIGRPSGAVEAYLLSADGTATRVAAHPPVAVLDPPDPRWDDGMPQHMALLETARAAERAGDWPAAQVAAERLAAHAYNDLGDQHPHTVLARELQGHFAVRARDWATAARLHTSAAAGRNRLLAPTEATARTLKNAVYAWMRAPVDKDLTETGYTLAHLLVMVRASDAFRQRCGGMTGVQLCHRPQCSGWHGGGWRVGHLGRPAAGLAGRCRWVQHGRRPVGEGVRLRDRAASARGLG